jgi:hypothetical protein
VTICGHRLREHVRFLAPLIIVIAAVWLLRILTDVAGAPRGVVRFFSLTVTSALCVLVAAAMIHRSRFGSYPNVVAASVLLVAWEQILIVLAILFAGVTHTSNIFTAPEYSNGLSQSRHIIGQLTFGVGLGVIYGAAMGCLLLWILNTMLPPSQQSRKPHHRLRMPAGPAR